MLLECLACALHLWREALLGSGVIVVGVAAGWWLGKDEQAGIVRIVAWGLRRIVHPLLRPCSWARRAAVIALNNTAICLAVVLLGAAGHVAWLGVAGIGLGLGIGLRQLSAATFADAVVVAPPRRNAWVRAAGYGLNLLEVPAIMLSAGLGLAQGALSTTINAASALSVFGIVAVPLLIVSAAGEALWMSTGFGLPDTEPTAAPDHD